jgi:quinol monooxygenase YgiN
MAASWPVPPIPVESPEASGPVLVTVQYQIDPQRLTEFRSVMQSMEAFRRRDGALQWGLFADPTAPGFYIEEFLVESWLDHERQHQRVTLSDQRLHDRVWALHKGVDAPRVSHYLADEPSQ